MNTMQKLAFQYITPALCVLSLSTSTIDAQNCCPDPCCPDWGSILIPVLAGAAAGAGVAAAMDNRGKKGSRGHRGPAGADGTNGTNGVDGQNGLDGLDGQDGKDGKNGKNGHNGKRGPRGHRGEQGHRGERGHRGPRGHQGEPGDPWVADVGQALTFDFALTLAAGLSGPTGDIVPFVEAPDGRVLEAQHFDPTSTNAQTTSLTITNPIYGTYHFGYFFPAHFNATGVAVALGDDVVTSRDATITAYLDGFTLPSPLDADFQFTHDFTYFINDDA